MLMRRYYASPLIVYARCTDSRCHALLRYCFIFHADGCLICSLATPRYFDVYAMPFTFRRLRCRQLRNSFAAMFRARYV